MAVTINSNILSINAQKHLETSQKVVDETTERISAGKRVNSAADDAAVLAIAERLNAEVRGLNTAMRNTYEGSYVADTADGGLEQVSNNLQRMRELAVQAGNGSYTEADRANLDSEFFALNEDIARIAKSTTYNGTSLLDGSTDSINIQTGTNSSDDDKIALSLTSVDSVKAEEASGDPASISTSNGATSAIDQIDSLFRSINSARASFGAAQNTLDNTIGNLQTRIETQSSTRSTLIDADYAKEAADRASALLRTQASNAIAVQANVFPKSVLQLIV